MTIRTRDIKALQDKAARSRCFAHPKLTLRVLDGKIICNKCNGSLKIETLPSETEKYMTGATQSAAIHSKMSQKHGAWEMPGTTTTEVTDIALIEPTEEQIVKIGKRFSDQIEGFGNQLSEGDQVMAAQFALAGFQHFHLNVLQGRLYLNLRGREFNARRSMAALWGGMTLDIITDPAIHGAVGLLTDEILVKATLHEKTPNGLIVAMEDFGRAGGILDPNPLARPAEWKTSAKGKRYLEGGKALQMATARGKCRVLIAGAPVGVNIGTYYEEVGVVVTSDGKEQVRALTEGDPDTNPGATYPAEDDSVTVNEETGEITTEPVNRNTSANRQELADRLKANGITKEQVESLNVNPSQMLIDGSEPHFIADAISALLTKPAEPKARVEGDEETIELPW